MSVVIFIASLLFCSFVLSAIDSSTDLPKQIEKPDYHYVPYAGDVFGA